MASKKDFTQVAHAVFMQATGQSPKQPKPTARQEASRKGGLKGGKARMDAMTAEQRTALALKGVAGRKKAPASKAGAGKTSA
jgi:hypothetical protein